MGGNIGNYHPQKMLGLLPWLYHMTAMEKCPDLICDLTELGKIHHLSGRLEPLLLMMEKNRAIPVLQSSSYWLRRFHNIAYQLPNACC